MRKKSFITVTDQFCGAGGSSIGATKAGAELRLALNHWQLAIDTHNTNFPKADHDCTDISACDPRRYPSTDILITSPECTNHTLAKGVARRRQSQLNMFETAVAALEILIRDAESVQQTIQSAAQNLQNMGWWEGEGATDKPA